jgi:hypothetical protein
MTDVAVHALIALLLPAFSFLVLAVGGTAATRREAAAWFSILCAAGSLLAAVIAWTHGPHEIGRHSRRTIEPKRCCGRGFRAPPTNRWPASASSPTATRSRC